MAELLLCLFCATLASPTKRTLTLLCRGFSNRFRHCCKIGYICGLRNMATALKTKSTPVVAPTTCQKSQTLIKQLVALAVSNVAYNRAFFPEDAFIEQEFEGKRVKVLNSKTKCENALVFQNWINSALEAFDKGYLKQLMVCLKPDSDDAGIILEAYKFTFNNKNDDVEMLAENSFGSSARIDMGDMKKIREDYTNLIHSAANLPEPVSCKLYEKVRLCVKLIYNDEVTPMDYEPEGFHKADNPKNKFILETLTENQGKVTTGWHSMKLSTKTVKDPVNAPILEKNSTGETDNLKHKAVTAAKTVPNDAVCSPGIFSQPTQNFVAIAPENIVSPRTQQPSENPAIPLESPDHPAVSAVSKSGTQTPSEIRNAIVDCVCETDEESHGLIILCSLCHRWQHGACYRIVLEENVPPRFCCFFCNNEDTGNMCYDQTLIKMDKEHRKEVCLYRKALIYCLNKRRLNMRTFAQDLSLSDSLFEKIQKLLEDDNVLAVSRRGTLSHVRTVNNDHLTNVIIPKYFHDVEGCSAVNKAQETTDNQ